MLGTILNTILVFIGGSIGFLFGKKIPERIHKSIINIFGVIVIFLGFQMASTTKNIFLVIISLLCGSFCGEIIHLESKINFSIDKITKCFIKTNNKAISQSIVTSILIFCTGPMTILGSINAGLTGDNKLLFIKSILDGATAIFLAASLGIGVVFSAGLVFIIQTTLVISASLLKDVLTVSIVNEISAVAGLIIFTIGLNLLEIKRIKSINLLPSVIFIMIFQMLLFSKY